MVFVEEMKIVIVTEGFQATGYGHITRCISIYQAFEEIGLHPFLIINGDKNAQNIVQYRNTLFYNWLDDRDRLFDEIQNKDIVVIDSYLADISVYNKIAQLVKTPIYFDDDIRLNYPKGIILNGCIGAENLPYPKEKNKIYLLGAKYQLIRKAFWNIPSRDVDEKVKNILITIGATDIRNLTPRILKVLVLNFPEMKKNIVLSKDNSNVTDLEKIGDVNSFYHYNLNDEEMRNLMLQSHLAISAAGQTLYELAVTSVPSIVIGISNNQKNNIFYFKKAGIIRFLGNWDEFTDIKLKASIENCLDINFRKQMLKNMNQMIVNLGANNIVKFITSKYKDENFVFNK